MEFTLAQFIQSGSRNSYVREGVLNLYVRRHFLWINEKSVLVLAIARVESESPGKGAYRSFLLNLQKTLPVEFAGIFIECIHNPRLYNFHIKLGNWVPYKPETPDRHLVWMR